ncbi:MAG: aconitate hydratase AcnA [Candidatus Helarchaeota archaeon]
MTVVKDAFDAKGILKVHDKNYVIYRLNRLEELGLGKISHLPNSIKILLESVLRNVDGKLISEKDVEVLAKWTPTRIPEREIPFIPARVVLQDFTGVPAVVDFAALRSAMQRLGGDPTRINPVIPAALIIDHSVQVDYFGSSEALMLNEKKEYERNRERYALLRWAQQALDNFQVVPPSKGIIHQINLEYLAKVIQVTKRGNELVAFPDTVLGTDSHTTMINGLGVLGWGVGGIEAEATMLGQPYYMPAPEVIGVKLIGDLKPEVTATDLVLTITQKLRQYGVVGKFVEFSGSALSKLSLPDRATISNMTPEYGATVVYFPIDEITLDYLKLTGRDDLIELVRAYSLEQGLFSTPESTKPKFTDILEIDLGSVEPCLAGPRRPQDRIPLNKLKTTFEKDLQDLFKKKITNTGMSQDFKEIKHGSIVIAAITSCTNTSNPSVLIGAGLLAKKAVEKGLKAKPFVKTSLAPGSRVVTDYLKAAGLLPYLEKLGFHVVGYGCTTCIGNSGPISEDVVKNIKDNDLVVAAVLSGNRNFEGRINPLVKTNYLASPLLVVAFAIAGSVDVNLISQPLGYDLNGDPIYLKDFWPKKEEIERISKEILKPDIFREQYSKIFEGTKLWNDLTIPQGNLYDWDSNSTYIQEAPFFQDFPLEVPEIKDLHGARVLALLGDSITTDHISPAGAIPVDEPAGQYLISKGIAPRDFNSFGSRRGNHDVMIRGTFGNIRLKNKLVPEKEGGWTKYLPSGLEIPIYDAAMKYKESDIPLIIIAGKEYGTGSSRDWAAKGTYLLGVKAVIAESYERIHRSNLVGMAVLPLQFKEGQNAETLGIKGTETFEIIGVKNIKPKAELEVRAIEGEKEIKFNVIARLDTPIEIEYFRNGGILHAVLRNMIKKEMET